MPNKLSKKSIKEISKEFSNYLSEDTVFSTGIFILDYLLSGGLQNGNFYQIYGPSGCGKTTIALNIAEYFCSFGKNVVFIDTEGSLSTQQLKSTNVDKFLGENLFIINECTFDGVEKILDKYIETDELDLIILDSLAGLTNSGFMDLKNGISINTSSSMYSSRPLTNFMKKYKALSTQRGFSFFFTNQMRQRISTTGTIDKCYGSKSTIYTSDVIIKISEMTASSINKDFKSLFNSLDCGIILDLELIKSNKLSPITYPAYFKYGKGIQNICNFVQALVCKNVIKKNGSYFDFSQYHVKLNGIKNLIDYIKKSKLDLYSSYSEIINNFYEEIHK